MNKAILLLLAAMLPAATLAAVETSTGTETVPAIAAPAPSNNLRNAFLFTDDKGRQPGDLVTVIVMESAKASNAVSNKTNKNSGTNVDLQTPGSSPKVKFGADTKYDAGSSTERKGTLIARVTVKVEEVMPNGNLRIKGEQNISINKDKQILKVEGIVRPRDIDADNTVYSSAIADAKIEYVGKEPRSKWIHWLGPIGWIYNWLF